MCITHAELSPDISVKDEVLESEPGDVEDDEEGERGDAASLESTLKLSESMMVIIRRRKMVDDDDK